MSLRAAALYSSSLGAVALLGAGCSGCPDSHPYVPYTIGPSSAGSTTAAPVAEGGPSAEPAADVDAGAGSEPAIAAPPGATSWSLDGTSPPIVAPAGLELVSGLRRDFDGDQVPDVFALARPADGSEGIELLYYRAGGGTPATFAPPALAHEGTCAPVRRLATAGPNAVQVELGARCAPGPSAADRWFAVFAVPPGGSPGVRLAVSIADPQGTASLSIDATTADRDHDGRSDVTLQLALEGGVAPFEAGPRVSTVAAWLDRSAGLGRDVTATEAAFTTLASAAVAKARSSKEAATVPALADQARALWRALCADDRGQRRLSAEGIAAGACGSTRPLETLGLAEVRSYVTAGDVVRAGLALDRASKLATAKATGPLAEASQALIGAAPIVIAKSVRTVLSVPDVPRGKEPGWGPLAFEPSGKLLVRTRAGVARVDPEAGDEADAEVKAWPSAVTGPGGDPRWIEAYDPCDGVAVRATFAPASGDDLRDLVLPVPPPFGDRCGSSRGASASTLPIAWGASGLLAVVDGRALLFAPDLSRAGAAASFSDVHGLAGSPLSPDGRTMVLATPVGLVVRGAGKPHLFRLPKGEGGGAGDDRFCAVGDDGARVACVRAGRAWVALWPAP